MNFNLGEWIVKALELFRDSPVLRRMFYWTLAVIVVYGAPALIRALVESFK